MRKVSREWMEDDSLGVTLREGVRTVPGPDLNSEAATHRRDST